MFSETPYTINGDLRVASATSPDGHQREDAQAARAAMVAKWGTGEVERAFNPDMPWNEEIRAARHPCWREAIELRENAMALSYSRALADSAARKPDDVAITCADRSITWGELESRTNRLARAFQDMGVTKNSFVTVGLPNSIEFFEACIAAWKLGATPQPISYRLPDRERQAIVELADSSLVVGAEPAAHPNRTVIPVGWQPDPSIDDSQLPDVIADHWKAPTSGGSTGRPKLIVATDPSVRPATPGIGQKRDGVVFVPGPLYHNAPFSFSSGGLMQGNHVVILPKFDAEATLRAIDEHRPDWLLLVPTMMQRITRLPDEVREKYDVSSLAGRVAHGVAVSTVAQGEVDQLARRGEDLRAVRRHGGPVGHRGAWRRVDRTSRHGGQARRRRDEDPRPGDIRGAAARHRRRGVHALVATRRTSTSAPRRASAPMGGRASVTWARWTQTATCTSPIGAAT